ncbi:M56 family metallopeptidase [Paraglaciecola sp.]|uniref:M56 family metallopeptidase n=1 Tax=Paraglaciecola sp. TaxID=1920173 RepID=UPI00273F6F73|nr:M56 family metallopeptidase [Paraglaciecola sp.]MDP5030609.1 M56 family metallopeptidase [Paraglaciecola sp.]
MINWLISQQLVLSLALLLLLVAEKKALKKLSANHVYALWWLVPLILLANNLPQDLLNLDNPVLYQYAVKVSTSHYTAGNMLSFKLVWWLGVFCVLSIACIAQKQIHQGAQRQLATAQMPVALPKYLKVLESQHVRSPLISGIRPARLLLPADFTTKFSLQQQQLILQHELVHFQRGDNLYNLIALLFVAVFWFNPLVWLAYGAFRRSQELACDETVLINKSTQEKMAYSRALLLCVQAHTPTLSIYSQYGAKHPMLLRIERIKNKTKVKKSSLVFSIITSLGLLAGVAMANQQGNAIETSKINEASPIVRIEPKYPLQAAQQKIEGSVVLQFDIEKDGSTSNIKIIKAEPDNVFGKTSIAALQKWQYKPQIVGGQAQVQRNILVQLDYRLDENPGPIKPLIETVKVVQ